MKTYWITNVLLVFVGSGLWALALMHGGSKANAQPVVIPRVIKAHEFKLVDANGQERATLGVGTLGEGKDISELDLYDASGHLRTTLAALKFGSWLSLDDANGTTRLQIAVAEDGPVLYLYDANSTKRALLGINPKNTKVVTKNAPFTITIFDKKGKVIYQRP